MFSGTSRRYRPSQWYLAADLPTRQFEAAFRQAERIIAASPGYLSHELRRCVEKPNRYLLLWKRLLHHFYDPFPTVEHYEPV